MSISKLSIKKYYLLTKDIVEICEAIATENNKIFSFPHPFFYEEDCVTSPSDLGACVETEFDDGDLPVLYAAFHNETLIGFISTYFLDDSVEICSFIHPDYLGHGVFRTMFDTFADDYLGYDIFVTCHPKDCNLKSLLEHFGFSLNRSELLMAIDSKTYKRADTSHLSDFVIKKTLDNDESHYTISGGNGLIGEGFSYNGDNCATIHDIFINEDFRNNRYGLALVNYMISDLLATKSSILLHVTKENAAAFSLYKKLGFTVNEQSDYYLSML